MIKLNKIKITREKEIIHSPFTTLVSLLFSLAKQSIRSHNLKEKDIKKNKNKKKIEEKIVRE